MNCCEDRYAHYVLYESIVRQNVIDIIDAFKRRYSNFALSYSIKTNYVKRVQEIVKEEGGLAEIVSPFEYDYARLTFESNQIIYNGPIPSKKKYLAARNGSIVNVDNIDELKAIIQKAKNDKLTEPIGIGLRVTFNIGNKIVSRFGFSVDDGDTRDFDRAINIIRESKVCYLAGFHCHIGAGRPVKYWTTKARKMSELARKYYDDGVRYIDLGGGMFGHMIEPLQNQFDDYEGDFDEYAKTVSEEIKKYFPQEQVKLIIEPGTAIVGDAMELEAHVTSIKKHNEQWYITLDCAGTDLGFVCEVKDLPISILRTGAKERVSVEHGIMVGNTCLEFDRIKKSYSGEIGVGDTVIFPNVGAYSINNARQFITPRLGVYDVRGNEIQRPETPRDMFIF